MTNQTQTAVAKTPVEMKDGMVQLNNIEGAYRYAQYVVKSGLAPKGFDSPEKVMIAWQHGAELGMKPMQSLQHIGVINGRPGLWGKGSSAIVMNSGQVQMFEEFFEGTIEDGTLTAVCRVKRKGMDSTRTERFSMTDAKKAGLWGKNTWVTYPKDMLMYKARSRAFVIFSDILAGLPILEDIAEIPPDRTPLIPKEDGPPSLPPSKEDPLLKTMAVVTEPVDETTVVDTVPVEAPEKKEEKPDNPIAPTGQGEFDTATLLGMVTEAKTKKELNSVFVTVNLKFSEGAITEEQYNGLCEKITAKNRTLK